MRAQNHIHIAPLLYNIFMSLLVYTAITNGYDHLVDPPFDICEGSEFVAFVDSSKISMRWEARVLNGCDGSDPCRVAKIYKVLPHRFFPDAKTSLWVDGSIDFLMPFPVINLLDYLKDADLVIFEHPNRHCLYQEACECMIRGLDDPTVILNQVNRYTQEGYPANIGLVEASVILRRHTKRLEAFNEDWWSEIKRGSRRDQISFNYVAWRHGLKINYFPGGLRRKCRLFRRRDHLIPRSVTWAS
jgi:hypothetical protein